MPQEREISIVENFVQYQLERISRLQMAPRSLKNDPMKREKRIRELIARLEAGTHVQNRDLEAVLNPGEWTHFCRDLKDPYGYGQVSPLRYPDEIDDYFKLIDQADAKYLALERSLQRGSGPDVVAKLSTQASEHYQHAQERLEEILGRCTAADRGAVEYWLDRPIEYAETGQIDIGLEPTTVPRKRGSSSKHARIGYGHRSTVYEHKKQTKIGHLSMALDMLTKPPKANAVSKKMAQLDVLRKLARR